MIKIFKIDKNAEDQRIDRFLRRQFANLSQSFIEKNLRKKNILLNNNIVKSSYLLKTDDKLTIKNFSKKTYSDFVKSKTDLNISKTFTFNFKKSILFESNNFLVIDKWAGIATQGGTNIIISIDKILLGDKFA